MIRDLRVAVALFTVHDEIRPAVLLAELTPKMVAAYFACDRVNKTRAGKPKSKLSSDRAKRVLRQTLVWAKEHKLIDAAPLPTA